MSYFPSFLLTLFFQNLWSLRLQLRALRPTTWSKWPSLERLHFPTEFSRVENLVQRTNVDIGQPTFLGGFVPRRTWANLHFNAFKATPLITTNKIVLSDLPPIPSRIYRTWIRTFDISSGFLFQTTQKTWNISLSCRNCKFSINTRYQLK